MLRFLQNIILGLLQRFLKGLLQKCSQSFISIFCEISICGSFRYSLWDPGMLLGLIKKLSSKIPQEVLLGFLRHSLLRILQELLGKFQLKMLATFLQDCLEKSQQEYLLIFKNKFPKKSLKKHRRNRKKNFYRNPWRNLWWINGKLTGMIYVGIMGETSEVTLTRILKGIPSGNSKMVS